jgi:hypothetical protein
MHKAPNTSYGYWFLKITLCFRLLQYITAIGSPKITLCIWLLKHLMAIGSPKSPYGYWFLKITLCIRPLKNLFKDLEQAGSEKPHLAIWLAPGLIPRTTPFSVLSTKVTAVQNSTTSCLSPGPHYLGPLGLLSPYPRHRPRFHESLP